MVSADGHVINRSADFKTRTLCELDAIEQALPVVGLSRRLSRRLKARPESGAAKPT